MRSTLLDIYGLKKTYDNDQGIKDVTFKLYSEHILGFIGPNGSGKSTTIKTILGLLKKDNGTVKMFGKNMDKFYADIMQFVGYSPSDSSLYEDLSGQQFLSYSASFYEIDYQNSIDELAKRLEVNLKDKIKNMSLGDKKKIGIINALFTNPKLIILDEPTMGLDPTAQLELLAILRERKAFGSGILFCTNDLSTIHSIVDEIMVINDGVITNTISRNDFKKSHKKIMITSSKSIVEKQIAEINVKELIIEENQASFLFAGDISELIKRLNSMHLTDITIEDPSLDEYLIHYFQ